jgi:hypothetical protein
MQDREGTVMDEKMLDNLSEETKAKVLAAKTPEEMLAVAKSEGVELSLDELDEVSGGSWNGCDEFKCNDHC